MHEPFGIRYRLHICQGINAEVVFHVEKRPAACTSKASLISCKTIRPS